MDFSEIPFTREPTDPHDALRDFRALLAARREAAEAQAASDAQRRGSAEQADSIIRHAEALAREIENEARAEAQRLVADAAAEAKRLKAEAADVARQLAVLSGDMVLIMDRAKQLGADPRPTGTPAGVDVLFHKVESARPDSTFRD